MANKWPLPWKSEMIYMYSDDWCYQFSVKNGKTISYEESKVLFNYFEILPSKILPQ